jgi:hypothetical protein
MSEEKLKHWTFRIARTPGLMTIDEFIKKISVPESKPGLLLRAGQYVHFTKPRIPVGYIQCPVILRGGVFFNTPSPDFLSLRRLTFLLSMSHFVSLFPPLLVFTFILYDFFC